MFSLEAMYQKLKQLFQEGVLTVDVTSSDIATETTLSNINSKIVKADTDNVKIIGEVAYDSANDWKKVSVENDSVGLAKDSTLQAVDTKLGNIDGKVVKVDTDNVKVVGEVAYDGTNDWKKVSVENDSVGLAKESTLQAVDTKLGSIDGKITKVDTDNVKVVSEVAYDSTNDWKKVSVENDSVGLAKESTLSSVLSQLDITLSQLRDALRPIRSTPVQQLSSQSIDAGGVAEFTVDASETDGFSGLVVTVKATYDSSATQGVRVRWVYSPDGTNFDTVEDAEDQNNYEDLTFTAGATRERTILIPIYQPYVKVQVVNLDTSYAVTVDAWSTLMR